MWLITRQTWEVRVNRENFHHGASLKHKIRTTLIPTAHRIGAMTSYTTEENYGYEYFF